jgi:membrane-associated protease RseP (regulator of RpoE activity)
MTIPPHEGPSLPSPSDTAAPSVLRMDLLPPPGASTPADPARPRWAFAAALLLATVATAVTVTPAWYLSTRTDLTSPFEPMLTPALARWTWSTPEAWHLGLQIALPALFILLVHELGHYVACRLYGIRSTLPYFIPAPFNFGSLGAFIRIQSPIPNRRQLFDVGFAGPAAGFVALVPWLLYGIAHSTPVALASASADAAGSVLTVPGRCLAIQLAAWPFHGWLPSGTVLDLHPFALAAWIGLFATALNLITLGQLDGGHVLYAAVGRLQHRLAWPLWTILAALTYLWPGWAVWCVLLLWIRVKHPPVWDESEPLDRRRVALAVVALVMLVLCFMPVPIAERLLP